MSYFEAVIMGLVQGLCEFLPISSSGHLALFEHVFALEAPSLLLATMLHVGTLAAVLLYFAKDIWQMLRHPVKNRDVRMLILATIPAVVVALLLKDHFEALFSGRFLGVSFLLTTVVLFVSTRFHGVREEITAKDAVVMGGFQAVAALLPGLSRSGSTITGGVVSGLSRTKAARFSFLMSIPAILGSVVLEGKGLLEVGLPASLPLGPLLVGVAVSCIAGLFAIRFMMKLLEKVGLQWFGLYTLVLGILVLADQYVTHIFF